MCLCARVLVHTRACECVCSPFCVSVRVCFLLCLCERVSVQLFQPRVGERQLPAPCRHCLTPGTQPLMTVCHCLRGGGITCANDSLPCLMTRLLPHHLGATGALWACGQREVDELNTFASGVPVGVGKSINPTLPRSPLGAPCAGNFSLLMAFRAGAPGLALLSTSGGAWWWLLPRPTLVWGPPRVGVWVMASGAAQFTRVKDKPPLVESGP